MPKIPQNEKTPAVSRYEMPAVLADLATAPLVPVAMPVKQAAEFIGGSRSRVYELIAAGLLIAVKDGRKTLIDTGSLKRYATTRQPVTKIQVARTIVEALRQDNESDELIFSAIALAKEINAKDLPEPLRKIVDRIAALPEDQREFIDRWRMNFAAAVFPVLFGAVTPIEAAA